LGAYSRSYSFVDGEIPTETEWNVDIDGIIAVLNGQLDDANVDYTSADGIVTMARTQTISGAKTFTAASQFSSTVTVGVDDTGYDVQFFGATTGKSLLWDESADKLIITGDMSVSGTISDLGTVTTVDINGGTIDGATIGGASAGAGTFTTLAGTTSVVAASDITITSGSILSASGAITFGNENLTTTGTLASGTITVSSDLALATGSITSASGAISFGNENLSTTGTLGAGAGTLTSLSVSDGNITNVGDIALDSITSDGTTITIGTGSTMTFTDNTTIAVSLGNDAGDDFTIDSTAFVVEGDTGKVGIGTSSPSSKIDIRSSGVNLSWGSSGAIFGNLAYTTGIAQIYANTSTALQLGANNNASHLTIGTSGSVYIGDTTNAYMTQGLTINQGTNDDEIFALKSTDMAHGVTDTTETDTLFSIRKTSTSGGVQAQCFSEDDIALNLWGVHTNDNTTKTTGGSSTVRVTSLKKSGTAVGGPGANANLFSVFNGGVGSVFIVDAEGDLYADGGTSSTNMVTQYDEYEDAQLIRAFSTMGNAKSVIKDKWDNFVSYNEDTLVELGILGAPLKDKPLYCVTKLQKLQNGAIWQLYTQIMDMAERIEENVPQLRGKLIPQIGA
jgi:hypothetical protein